MLALVWYPGDAGIEEEVLLFPRRFLKTPCLLIVCVGEDEARDLVVDGR